MKKFLYFLIPVLAIIFTPIFVFAGDPYSIEGTASQAGLTGYGGDPAVIVGKVISTALAMVGVLFFGLMLYGGINWMIDRGNEERSKKALHTITTSVIGVTIILASYAITNFVFRAGGAFTPAPGPTNPNVIDRDATPDNFPVEPEVGVCCRFETPTAFETQWIVDGNAASCDSVCLGSSDRSGCEIVPNITTPLACSQ